MAVIVDHQPAVHEHYHELASSNNGLGWLVGLILAIVLIALLFNYGLPLLRSAATPVAPQVNVPGKIDVNVNHAQ